MARTLVSHVDSAGLPRAFGVSEDPAEARAEADRQLERYLAGDSSKAGQAPYTVRVDSLDDGEVEDAVADVMQAIPSDLDDEPVDEPRAPLRERAKAAQDELGWTDYTDPSRMAHGTVELARIVVELAQRVEQLEAKAAQLARVRNLGRTLTESAPLSDGELPAPLGSRTPHRKALPVKLRTSSTAVLLAGLIAGPVLLVSPASAHVPGVGAGPVKPGCSDAAVQPVRRNARGQVVEQYLLRATVTSPSAHVHIVDRQLRVANAHTGRLSAWRTVRAGLEVACGRGTGTSAISGTTSSTSTSTPPAGSRWSLRQAQDAQTGSAWKLGVAWKLVAAEPAGRKLG